MIYRQRVAVRKLGAQRSRIESNAQKVAPGVIEGFTPSINLQVCPRGGKQKLGTQEESEKPRFYCVKFNRTMATSPGVFRRRRK